jgi:formyltetrahydrofolate-dependent phosphoribosylglycinamide formyltransferase
MRLERRDASPRIPGVFKDKFKTAGELAEIAREMGRQGRRLVLTNGCFDLLHVGHVRYLQEARALGDALLVAVNGDASVRALKGAGRPVNGELDRAEVLAGLACVDYVTIFEETRVSALIAEVRPQLYAKGGDYTLETLDPGERGALEAAGAGIRLLQLVPGRSTTATLARAAGQGGKKRMRLGVLGSGKGSNFRAIADAIRSGNLNAEVRVVISDVAGAGILDLARERGIPAVHVHPGKYRTRLEPEAEAEVVRLLKEAEVDWVVLAGYMRMVKSPLLEAFPRRIVNIHPSLLPQFPGLEAWAQAVAAGVAVTGCTVHYVDSGMDTGEVIAQKTVPVHPGDTPATLHARIQEAEHALYPAVLRQLAGG